MPLSKEDRRLVIRIVIDTICLCLVGIPVIIFFAVGQPFRRGFYCDDESIHYPYKDSTITNKMLYCIGVLLPAGVIFITEILNHYAKIRQQKQTLSQNYRPLLWNTYKVIWVFGFGACVSQLTTDIAKYTIGRLRPHFIVVCEPNVDLHDCKDSHSYITNFECTGSDEFRIREARLSFLSGHASFSAYCMVFLAMYLESQMTWNPSKLLKPFLQTLMLLAAFYTALSRVSDYKHHWSDVLAGSIQGTVVAVIVVLYVSDFFSSTKDNPIKETNGTINEEMYDKTPI